MLNWYTELSLVDRSFLCFIVVAFVLVMFFCWQFLILQKTSIGWFRGIHSTPIFQFVLWGGAAPLIIPFLYLYYKRSKKLKTAPFIGNLFSRKFHRKDCLYQQQISSNLKRYPFDTIEDAINAGYSPCLWCKPK